MEDKKGLFASIAEQLDKYNDERYLELKGLLSELLDRVEKLEQRMDEKGKAAPAQELEIEEDAMYEHMTEEDEEAEPEEEEFEAEEFEQEPEKEEEEPIAQEEKKEEGEPDWYDWEVDYPQEEVEDLTASMGINDKMQFIGELFDGDSELFSQTMHQLEGCESFKEVKNYLMESFADWDFRGDAVYNFMMHIRRKFRK